MQRHRVHNKKSLCRQKQSRNSHVFKNMLINLGLNSRTFNETLYGGNFDPQILRNLFWRSKFFH